MCFYRLSKSIHPSALVRMWYQLYWIVLSGQQTGCIVVCVTNWHIAKWFHKSGENKEILHCHSSRESNVKLRDGKAWNKM